MNPVKKKVCDAQIDKLLREFDFKRVRQIMAKVQWTWMSSTGDAIPSTAELREVAEGLLWSAVKCKGYATTGGFAAYCNHHRNKKTRTKHVYLQLFWGINSLMLELDDSETCYSKHCQL